MTLATSALQSIREGPKAMLHFLSQHAGDGPIHRDSLLRGGYKVETLSFSLASRNALILTVVDVALDLWADRDEVILRENVSWSRADLLPGAKPAKKTSSKPRSKKEASQVDLFTVLEAASL